MKNFVYFTPVPPKKTPKRNKTNWLRVIALLLTLLTVAAMFAAVGLVGYKGALRAKDYYTQKQSEEKKYTVNEIEIKSSGREDIDARLKDIINVSAGDELTDKDLRALEAKLADLLPFLTDYKARIARRTGRLRVSFSFRTPVALIADGETLLVLDKEGRLFDADKRINFDGLPRIEMPKPAGERLDKNFVSLVRDLDYLRNLVNYEKVVFLKDGAEAEFVLKDTSVIQMGSIENINEKAKTAAKILKYNEAKSAGPFVLNMRWHKYGKAYLTKK